MPRAPICVRSGPKLWLYAVGFSVSVKGVNGATLISSFSDTLNCEVPPTPTSSKMTRGGGGVGFAEHWYAEQVGGLFAQDHAARAGVEKRLDAEYAFAEDVGQRVADRRAGTSEQAIDARLVERRVLHPGDIECGDRPRRRHEREQQSEAPAGTQ